MTAKPVSIKSPKNNNNNNNNNNKMKAEGFLL